MPSQRANQIQLSPTMRIAARALAMKAQGVDVVDFSVGEPDFPTPEKVKKAAKAALDANFTKYTANDGIPELRQAICRKLERENGLRFTPDEVLVSPGAKAALFCVVLALVDEGDDVIIPTPCWVSYPDQVRLAKGNPVFVRTREEDGFHLRPRDLADAITPNTRVLILNYPCNPTGAVYSREELEELGEICQREGIWVIADEIYEKLVYDGRRFVSIAAALPSLAKQTVVINGFSKAFSMTGWRLGYAAGPRELIAAASKIQSHNTSNATSFVQKAALVALEECDLEVERMRAEFERRRNLVVAGLSRIPGLSCPVPEGAFYAMPNVSRFLDKEFSGSPVRNSYGLAYYLLKEAKLAVVPGDAFMAPEHIRLSFATSEERIREGLRRLAEALAKLEEPKRLRPRVLNNVLTKVNNYVAVRPIREVNERNQLLQEAERALPADALFLWNGLVGGVVVQLRTNSPHVADFFQENFWPSPLEGGPEPHAVVFVVKDLPGREPAAAVSLPTDTAFVWNTAFYGQTREAALLLAAEAAARTQGTLWVHAAAISLQGRGVLMWGAPGSGRTAFLAHLLRQEGARLVATDGAFVRFTPRATLVEACERKFYLKAKWLKHLPDLSRFLDRAKLENMVTDRALCTLDHGDADCPLDSGAPVCLAASSAGRILLDPVWLGGARQVEASLAVFLARDPLLSASRVLSSEEALRLITSGHLPGQEGGSRPFLNPHLPPLSMEQEERLRAQYARFLSQLPCLLLPAGTSPSALAQQLARYL
ncbi:MAG: aminotransferase class I/II-fold pyridoxal phosphate-dependent enzyme [Thermoanaerobaculum sp.]|nr:aminotransferase class I/II-fold pyridoxal phosphate-dependent enzyme [Thermoanaerobaculum sp.]